MGTSFGLGMYLDIPHTLPMLIGGVARDRWEDKKLTPRIDKIKEESGTTAAENQRALILLGTFMVAAGLLTGEAFFGTESSILSFIDSLWTPTDGNESGTFFGITNFGNSTVWFFTRMIGFIGLNVAIGFTIYSLFKRAGVIGVKSNDAILEA
jgi:hypothetical protein